MTLRRNGMGQLGFHVRFEGLIADVEPSGFAWQAGLRQGCRLVEVCEFVIEDIQCFVHITICVEVFLNYFLEKESIYSMYVLMLREFEFFAFQRFDYKSM